MAKAAKKIQLVAEEAQHRMAKALDSTRGRQDIGGSLRIQALDFFFIKDKFPHSVPSYFSSHLPISQTLLFLEPQLFLQPLFAPHLPGHIFFL